jgi:nucleoside-diphosphate-sugar epimerase
MAAARGRVYNLSDHRSIEDFAGILADALGKPRPRLRLPEGPVRLAVRTLGRLPGFPLTESRIAALTSRVVYAATRVERELGYSHTASMEDALSLCVGRWKGFV